MKGDPNLHGIMNCSKSHTLMSAQQSFVEPLFLAVHPADRPEESLDFGHQSSHS
jgi:hypothetical protein